MAEARTESTASLLGRVREGDREARERLAAHYLPLLRRWARGRLPGYARGALDTDDLVQTSLLQALERVDRFEARREGAFLAYLRRILVNAVHDEVRRARRRPTQTADDVLPDPGPSVAEEVIGREIMARYEAALEALPERQREAVILRIELGYGHDEVAAAIGAPSADAARMTVSRALVRIAEVLDGGA